MPHQSVTNIPRIGGMLPNGLFSGIEAVLREALTNPSPYYKLLLAYRGFEGIKRLRRHFPESAKKLNLNVPRLSEMKLDKTEMAQHGLQGEILALQTLDELYDHYKGLRDGCAHFFVGSRGKAVRQHLHLSSTVVHTCGRVAALMFMYVRKGFGIFEGLPPPPFCRRYQQRNAFAYGERTRTIHGELPGRRGECTS